MNAPEALIQHTAERLFREIEASPHSCAPEALRARWLEIDATGLDRILVPEAAGGFGADLADVVATLRSAGSRAVEAPIMEAIVARWLAACAGFPDAPASIVLAQWAPPLADGARRVAVPYGRAVARACCVDYFQSGTPQLVVFAVDSERLELGDDLAGEPRDRLALPGDAQTRPLDLTPDRIRAETSNL